MKKILLAIIFPCISLGQKIVSDEYIFESNYGTYTRSGDSPIIIPAKWWFKDNTKVEFDLTTLYEAEYDEPLNQPNQKIRWVLDPDDNSSFIYNSSNSMRGGRFYGLVKKWGKPPSSYFFYDSNVFRDNAMAVILESDANPEYKDIISIQFKKSDIEPLSYRVIFASSDYYDRLTLEEDFNAVFIFNDDLSTKIEKKLSMERIWDYRKMYKTLKVNESKWQLIDHKDKLISNLKNYSKVDIMLTNKKTKMYSSISLKGSSSALNKILGITKPSKKNNFEFAYRFGLSNFNPFDYEGYVLKFLDDAKLNHNINLDYVKKSQILTISKRLEDRTIALAAGMNDDKNVIIAIDPEMWLKSSPQKRWYIIYHELGHDILNFEHGTGGAMMDPETSGNYSWSRFEKDKETMFNHYKNSELTK